MIYDSKLMFNARTSGVDVPMACAGTDATVLFTDIVDLKDAHQNQGKPLKVGVRVAVIASTLTGGITCQFKATSCATVGGTYTPCGESAAYEVADLIPGKEIEFSMTEDVLEFVHLSAVSVGAVAALTVLGGIIS